MPLDKRLLVPKKTVCPVCKTEFERFVLRKSQFSIDKRDYDYRPVYIGSVKPRFYKICVCPECLYAAEDKYFCPLMSSEQLRQKELLDQKMSAWDANNRVKAAASGQQIWKDPELLKLKSLKPAHALKLKKVSVLLKKLCSEILQKGVPYNHLLRDEDLFAAVKAWELAAVCYRTRDANHRVVGYTYLGAAWAARDAFEMTSDEDLQEKLKKLEIAYLQQAVTYLDITEKATGIDDVYDENGKLIPKEKLPQSRVFEVMYILAGIHKILGDIDKNSQYLEQLMYAGGKDAQGIVLWFVKQARSQYENRRYRMIGKKTNSGRRKK